MIKNLAKLMAAMLVVSACGGSGSETTTTETTTTETTTTESTDTTEAVSTTTEATSVPIEETVFDITGEPELVGIPFGTDTETAVGALIEVFGEPDDDDSEISCPYFAETYNMRHLVWGSLDVIFTTGFSGSSLTGLVGFAYMLDEDGKPFRNSPAVSSLPEGVRFGDIMSDVVAELGGTIRPTEFSLDYLEIDGYSFTSFNPDPDTPNPSAPVSGIVVGDGYLDCD